MLMPRSNKLVASVRRKRCGCTFSTPATFPILFNKVSIPPFFRRGVPFPANNATLLSFLFSRYLFKYSNAISVRYTIRSLFPFPITQHSPVSIFMSEISNLDISDTRHPDEYKNSTNARSRIFSQDFRSNSSSTAV